MVAALLLDFRGKLHTNDHSTKIENGFGLILSENK